MSCRASSGTTRRASLASKALRKSRQAARRSGYRRYGKFHRRVRHYTGLTPAAVRAYACDNFEEALDRWLGTVVKVEDAEVGAIEETLTVRLRYVILARQERRYLNLEVAL